MVRNRTYAGPMRSDVPASLSEEMAEATSKACRIGMPRVSDVLSEAVGYGRGRQDMPGTTTIFIDGIRYTNGRNRIAMVADRDHAAPEGAHYIGSVRRNATIR